MRASSALVAVVVALVALVLVEQAVGVRGDASCSDIAPPSSSGGAPEFSCAQQAGWGKCGESWMVGYCLQTCWNCVSPPVCDDFPPDAAAGQTQYSCAQQKSWGKCSESWMVGYCSQSCFNCNQAPTTPNVPPPTTTCTDTPPDAYSSCQQQKDWGKCSESWMAGYCDQTCFACQGQHTPPSTPDVPPNVPTTLSTLSGPIDASLKLRIADTRFVIPSGQRVFLNGANQAWQDYARDFGVHAYDTALEDVLDGIHAAGGNFVRMWLHCDADPTPVWTGSQGLVTGIQPALLTDIARYVEYARSNGIYVLLSLFDFLVVRNHGGIYNDPAVRASYVTHALTPLVNKLKTYPNVLWEIFNEPEGSTNEWGWQDPKVSMAAVQKAANHYAHAIHTLDPTALVTVGAWSWKSFIAGQWTDAALLASSSNAYPLGTLDFWQVHYYDWMGRGELSSFDHSRDWFGTQGSVGAIDRPVLLGEFSQSGSDMQIGELYSKAFNLGYDGAAGWQANGGGYHADSFSTLLNGIRAASGAATAYVQPDGRLTPEPGNSSSSSTGTKGNDDEIGAAGMDAGTPALGLLLAAAVAAVVALRAAGR